MKKYLYDIYQTSSKNQCCDLTIALAMFLADARVGKQMYQRRGGLKYFRSEAKLQGWMLRHKVIGVGTYTVNVAKRLIVQVLLPNRLRSWVFQKFARKPV